MSRSRPSDRHRITLHLPGDEIRTITVAANEYIWDAANSAGIVLPAICHQGRCLSCAAKIVDSGPGGCTQRDADTYFPEDREAGFLLLCTAKPCSDLTISTHQQDAMREHRLLHNLPAPYA